MIEEGWADMHEPIATIEEGSCKAAVYEAEMPGQFTIRYTGQDGSVLCEEPLTGVSSYRQREQEIRNRLRALCKGREIDGAPLSDSGEY